MYTFGPSSKDQLATCVEPLYTVLQFVIKFWNCTVLEGKRTVDQQRKNILRGVSKTMNSKHLTEPLSRAVDVAPWPLKWPQKPANDSEGERIRWMKDMARYYYFSGFVLGVAAHMDIHLRHGGDWDMDRDIHDQDFDDLVHFELY